MEGEWLFFVPYGTDSQASSLYNRFEAWRGQWAHKLKKMVATDTGRQSYNPGTRYNCQHKKALETSSSSTTYYLTQHRPKKKQTRVVNYLFVLLATIYVISQFAICNTFSSLWLILSAPEGCLVGLFGRVFLVRLAWGDAEKWQQLRTSQWTSGLTRQVFQHWL